MVKNVKIEGNAKDIVTIDTTILRTVKTKVLGVNCNVPRIGCAV